MKKAKLKKITVKKIKIKRKVCSICGKFFDKSEVNSFLGTIEKEVCDTCKRRNNNRTRNRKTIKIK